MADQKFLYGIALDYVSNGLTLEKQPIIKDTAKQVIVQFPMRAYSSRIKIFKDEGLAFSPEEAVQNFITKKEGEIETLRSKIEALERWVKEAMQMLVQQKAEELDKLTEDIEISYHQIHKARHLNEAKTDD